uniref:Ribonuclease A-domain domain-containing protein n=1 Tax=Pelusios castaneus TaxID=367368 RepID=A0A8C8S019_9SAUR
MALKGPYPTLMLSFVLLGAWLALASGQREFQDSPFLRPGPQPTTNDRFLKRHWDFPKTASGNNTDYCSLQTRCRKINGQNNTFIHSSIKTINDICARARNGPVTSRLRFNITVCRFNSTTNSYKGMSLTRRIRVICRNRLPVRYVRFVRNQL